MRIHAPHWKPLRFQGAAQAVPTPPESNDDPTNWLIQGRLAMANQQWAQAEPLLKRALEPLHKKLGNGHPHVAQLRIHLGDTLMQLWDWDNAEHHLLHGLAALKALANAQPTQHLAGYARGLLKYSQWLIQRDKFDLADTQLNSVNRWVAFKRIKHDPLLERELSDRQGELFEARLLAKPPEPPKKKWPVFRPNDDDFID